MFSKLQSSAGGPGYSLWAYLVAHANRQWAVESTLARPHKLDWMKTVDNKESVLPGGGCDVGRGGMGLSSLGIFDPTCSVNQNRPINKIQKLFKISECIKKTFAVGKNKTKL